MPQCNDGPSQTEEQAVDDESLLKRLSSPNGASCIGYGSLITATNIIGALADHRLPSDVQDAPAVLEKFRKRRFVTASNTSDGLAFRGLIAQEEETISPELIGNLGDYLSQLRWHGGRGSSGSQGNFLN